MSRLIVEAPLHRTFQQSEADAGVRPGELIIEIPISRSLVEGRFVAVVEDRESGETVELEKYLRRIGASRERRVYLTLRHEWALVLVDRFLQGELLDRVYGVFAGSTWFQHLNDPRLQRAFAHARELGSLRARSFFNADGMAERAFAGYCKGVVWHPAPDRDFRRRAIGAFRRHSDRIYALPHSLGFFQYPDECLKRDVDAMVAAGIDLNSVHVMTIPATANVWRVFLSSGR